MTHRWILPHGYFRRHRDASRRKRCAYLNEPQNNSKDTPRVSDVQPLVKWIYDVDGPGTWAGKNMLLRMLR